MYYEYTKTEYQCLLLLQTDILLRVIYPRAQLWCYLVLFGANEVLCAKVCYAERLKYCSSSVLAIIFSYYLSSASTIDTRNCPMPINVKLNQHHRRWKDGLNE
uniref:Putative ovule protein n=1 Tax=Solanum chacoense TaxID=4108 RepID=A0A0V0GN86_SOLCH